MAKLRHIALIVPDPEKAAQFFEQAFDMTRAGTARRGIYMSDGVMNVALLKQEGQEKVGIYHFGMWVDDLDAAEKKWSMPAASIWPAARLRRTRSMKRSTSRRPAWCSISHTKAGPVP